MRLHLSLAILIGLGAMGSQAHASNWSMNGSSCIPNDTAIGNYFVTGGSVGHKGNSTALLTFYCPITNTWGSNKPFLLNMTFSNSLPGPGKITAQIIRLNANDGSLSTVSPLLESGQQPSNTGTQISKNFSHNFDFKNGYYYVRVDITRQRAPNITELPVVKLFGVSLDCTTCPAN
jgi:hypothetical protein